jgi:hypothetical protein
MTVHYDQGRYECRIVNQVLTENAKGNPELQLTVLPLRKFSGQEAEDLSDDYTRTIYLTMTDATMGTAQQPGWVYETLLFLGFNGGSFAQLDLDSDHAISFIDKLIQCTCQHDTYNGREREKWTIRRGDAATQAKPMAKKEIKSLDSRFKQLLKAASQTPQPAATPAAAGSNGAAAPPSGDDIPF